MALPKKKGFRAIVVDGQPYKWRFTGWIQILPDGPTGRRPLEVDIGWFDPFDFLTDPWNRPPDYEPRRITPSFIAAAIRYARSHGWDTETRGGKYRLDYRKDIGFRNIRNQPDRTITTTT